jgi:hypothetical protein
MLHKNTIIIICSLLSVFCYSQVNNYSISGETNLFELGNAILSEEDNFKNLFKNFPVLVENSQHMELLSYEYVGIAGTERNIKKIIGKNIRLNALGWNVYCISGGSVNGKAIYEKPLIRLEVFNLNIPKLEREQKIAFIAEQMKPDYKVYKIRWKYEEKQSDYFIFVNPDTKKVVTEGNMFAFSFPYSCENPAYSQTDSLGLRLGKKVTIYDYGMPGKFL